MLKIRSIDKHSPITLTITGDVSISQIGKLYAGLLKVPADAPEYFIHVREIDNLDLSFFQLLYAFTQKIKANNRKIALEWDLEDEYVRIMKESGIQKVFDEL